MTRRRGSLVCLTVLLATIAGWALGAILGAISAGSSGFKFWPTTIGTGIGTLAGEVSSSVGTLTFRLNMRLATRLSLRQLTAPILNSDRDFGYIADATGGTVGQEGPLRVCSRVVVAHLIKTELVAPGSPLGRRSQCARLESGPPMGHRTMDQ